MWSMRKNKNNPLRASNHRRSSFAPPKNHSLLEGESARQGLQPAVAPVGGSLLPLCVFVPLCLCAFVAQAQSAEIPPDQIQQSRNPALQTWEGDLLGQDSYKPGSIAQIEAVPNPGFTFDRWEGDTVLDPEEAKTFVDMEDHRQIKPVWKRIWNVIAQPDRKEAGKVEGGGAYPDGAEVTLSAEPNEGFTFLNWEGRGIRPEEKEEPTTTIVADGDHNIVARFQNDESQNQNDQQNQDNQQDQQDQDDQQDQQDQDDQQDRDESEPEEQDDGEEPQPEEENEGEDSPSEEPQVPPDEPQPVQMTLEEALRLLDAMEDDEKKLPLFIVQPPDPRRDPKKDW